MCRIIRSRLDHRMVVIATRTGTMGRLPPTTGLVCLCHLYVAVLIIAATLIDGVVATLHHETKTAKQ